MYKQHVLTTTGVQLDNWKRLSKASEKMIFEEFMLFQTAVY